jgi:SAM-dependent methyltransferase
MGNGFQVGDSFTRVLAYRQGSSGWTDALTHFHEDIAGDDHYIDRASRRQAVRSLVRYAHATGVVLEVGCSSGFLLPLMCQSLPYATIIGSDFVRGPLEALASRLPSVPLLQFDLVECPLPSASLDAVVLLNVLEHIEDDVAAIRQIARLLKPGGIAVIEVPAGPDLFDLYDRQLMHFRRYRMKDLTSKLRSANLTILDRSHLGFFFYPMFWLVKKWSRLQPPKSAAGQEKAVAARISAGRSSPLLHGLMNLEAALRNRVYFPFGIRCLVTCRKS